MTDSGELRSMSASRRYEVERIAAALAMAEAATNRLRTILPAGLSDVAASLLLSDVEQANQRIEWLRKRLQEDAEAAA